MRAGFLTGIGPAGTYCLRLDDDSRTVLRDAFERKVGSPSGAFTLDAVARSTTGRRPE
ncbi:hypothetical protein [Propionibacterium sp.]|uniref:hypothetical protein n=1 Tax=Propionibacterium sp. TaxID=1977903 RepID=UPI0039EB8712